MKKLLHIIATPRADQSSTLKVSESFIKAFKDKNLNSTVEVVDLTADTIPILTRKRVDGKYQLLEGKDLTGETKKAWDEILYYIDKFLSADIYLISTPMWNFSVPYPLKQYIDIIVQPKYLFHYTQNGPEGLVLNKKMVVVSARGGDYDNDQMRAYDFLQPYLRTVFGFVGITDITFISAQPMNMGAELQAKGLNEAREKAREVANVL